MSSTPPDFNYAKALGIESIPAAVVFAVLYVPFLAFFLRKSFTHPTYVHYTLTLFCTLRVAAFVIRAILASSASAGEILNLVITDEVLFGVGYFSLLFSAYVLVLDRILLSDLPPPTRPLLKLAQNRRLFHLALIAAIVMGVIAATNTNADGANTSTTRTLHVASTVIFLVLTILQALQTINLARSDTSGRSPYYVRDKDSIGIRYGNFIFLIIAALLLVREAFATATVHDSAKQNTEHFWYPLLATPEILAVLFYTAPGLVPRSDELPTYSMATSQPGYQ